MSPARALLGACILTLCVTGSRAQVVLKHDPPNDAMVAAIPQLTRDEFYSRRQAARREKTPRIVFVPGILGSKIDECRADGSQCTNIWGTIAALRRSDVDLSLRLDRVYRTDVVDSLFFKDVYGAALEHIRQRVESIASDSAGDALVTVFHYDWRLSNGENAMKLKERICEVRNHAETSPIVIVAHSMGGLMTKIWAARYGKEPCSNGKMPSVAQIVFVATPHLGSPKAIKAVAEGYNILFDELTGLKRYLGWWERNYLLEGINQAGISFPSLFELLPIRTSEYCLQQKPELAKATVPVVGEDDKPVNLFDVETWRKYDLLRRIGAPAVRGSYYEHDLAPLLRQAELLLCEIADFDPAKVADVTYIFGREKADTTYGWFHLHSGTSESIDRSSTIQGDGTVPVYSAENLLVSSTRQIMEVQADHTSIISSDMTLGLIDGMYSTAIRRADLQTARTNAQYASLLIAETAASGNLLPVSLDPKIWAQDDDEKFAIEVNKKALAAIGYKPADIAWLGSYTFQAPARAQLYAIAASSTDDSTQRLAWIESVARSSYVAGQFQNAIRSSDFLTTAAEQTLPPNDPNRVSLQKAADEVQGWAYLRNGDIAKFNEAASSYATKYSVSKDEFKEPNFSVKYFTGQKEDDYQWNYDPMTSGYELDPMTGGYMV